MSIDTVLKAIDYNAAANEAALRTLSGSLGGIDWRQLLIARGFGWHVDVGAFSTPIVGGGNGTVLDLDQPEFGISIPANYALIPIRFDITVLPGVQTTDDHETEALIAADISAAWAADGTATAETPRNMRGAGTTGCPASVFSAATADITDPVLGYELAHAAKTMNFGDATGLEMMSLPLLYEPTTPPIFIGPCAIYGYWGGSIAASGFANLDFIVVASSLFTGLS